MNLINLTDLTLRSIGEVLRANNLDEWLFYAKLAGGHHATAFVLRRVIIWSSTPTAQQRDGWFWKTHDQMSKETGLSEYQIKQAQKRLSKIIQVKVRKHNGKSITYYRLRTSEFIRAIKRTISRLTGKVFDLSPQKRWDDIRKKLQADTPKNLSRHSLTSYSNNHTHDNHTHTSSQPQANESTQKHDDDVIDIPDQFKKYSFTGKCNVDALNQQINRVGQSTALECVQHCIDKGGKSWAYIITALSNLPDAPIERDYSDVINKPAQPAQTEPEPLPEPQLTDADHKWIAVKQQFEMQFNRHELSGSRIDITGNRATIQLISDHNLRAITSSDKHPRGITYWIKRELTTLYGIDNPQLTYITA